eukprot:TRINITY_DN1914_c0_g1_i1.p1 TRINITY_DN1914_c0_g1~~TRINITY_DN1914_c0_g1_i1.p1  ORF type:complete len:267 (+),score=53.41 TRINITY_DN1914_c0_g1_i1:576-1376(+)
MYISIGSSGNVDTNTTRTVIRRFDPPFSVVQNWDDGVVFASGMRNEVGITFDEEWNLWGVENGVDNLARPPFGDIHNDNPSEELNLFGHESTPPGLFYGYPYCWTEYLLPGGDGPTSQWAHPAFMEDGIHTDAWCKNESNVVKPVLAMPAHVAPIDIKFYYGDTFDGIARGDAFVSWHGSWNRSPEQGYKVVHVSFQDGMPVSFDPFFFYSPPGVPAALGIAGVDNAPGWGVQPTGLAIGKCNAGKKECLFIACTGTQSIYAVTHY